MADDTPHDDRPEARPSAPSGQPRSGDGTVPAPAPPPDDSAEPAENARKPGDIAEDAEAGDAKTGGGKTGDAKAGGGKTKSKTGDPEAGGGGEPAAEVEDVPEPREAGEAAEMPSGALDPDTVDAADERAGDRDPATGGPVDRPAAKAAGNAVVPGPDTPDPAHDIEQRKLEAGVDHRFPFGRPGEPLGRAHPFVFGFTGALGVITAWMLVKAATSAKSVLVMIVVAMFLAVGLNPAVERLRRIGLPRGLAVGAVFMGVLLFFAGFVASLVQPISEQVTELQKNIPDYVTQMQHNKRLAEWDKRYGLLDRAQEAVNSKKFQENLTDLATGIGKLAVNGIFQSLTILILTLYFLSSLPQIKAFFYKLAPRSRRARVALLGDEILDRIGGYVAGQFTIAFIAGVTSYIFLEIMSVKYALALALVVAVTDLIPLVGATIGATIACLVAFLTGTVTDGVVCVAFYVIYQQVENYLIYPRVMKKTVDVQPAVTIVAALIGAALLGVVGALLAIPTAAAISLIIREVLMPRQETL